MFQKEFDVSAYVKSLRRVGGRRYVDASRAHRT